MSHLAAAKLACSRPGRSDIALVMEDDANLETLEHWPASLKDMIATLPPEWQVVNAAPSNAFHPTRSIHDAFAPSFFRREWIGDDYGTVGVIWNTSKGSPICARLAAANPIEIIRAAAEPCEPADTLLYRNMGSSFAATVPLLYFSSLER